jgi:predicted nucleic acid-binding protein
MRDVAYFDSSALVKLVTVERETDAIRAYSRGVAGRATSLIGLIETRRAATRRGDVDPALLVFALGGLEVIDLEPSIAERASTVSPALRTLDAIHLASALELGTDLAAIVTYDLRLAEAARSLGLAVESPG